MTHTRALNIDLTGKIFTKNECFRRKTTIQNSRSFSKWKRETTLFIFTFHNSQLTVMAKN
jgi:hypothetical protein